MTSSSPYAHHPIAEAFALIVQGEEPWFAINSFLHDWWCYAVDAREDLIAKPPVVCTNTTLEEKRWAAFCAATVEELCNRSSFPCPLWVNKPQYILEDRWFYHPQPSQREWLLSTTPASFQRHNVFVGGSVLDNKYELSQIYGSKPRWTIWTDEELQRLAQAKERALSGSDNERR
jgi:hypothetical protein